MLNRNSNTGTTADSSIQPKLQRPAKLLPNPMLAAVIGQRVKHIEQKYVGIIKADSPYGYCVVDLEDESLKTLYPFGIRAALAKLVAL